MVVFPNGLLVDAVIFDFDGIIVDTEPLHYRAFQSVLEPLRLGFSWQDYIDIYMGLDDRDAFIEAFSSRGKTVNAEKLHDLIVEKAHIFQDIIKNGISAYPGVVDLIRKLHNTCIPIAISSGALHSDINPILHTLNITDCFDIIVTAEDVLKSKPDPECYCLALERLIAQNPAATITPMRTFAVEDTPAGIASATAACLQVIAVTNSYPRDHLSAATCTVSSLEELIDFHIG